MWFDECVECGPEGDKFFGSRKSSARLDSPFEIEEERNGVLEDLITCKSCAEHGVLCHLVDGNREEEGLHDMASQDIRYPSVNRSDATSGLEKQDVLPDVTQAGTSDGNSWIVIQSMEQLSDAIRQGNLSQVKGINLDSQDIGSGHFPLADALASGQMSALEQLWLRDTRLTGDRCEAICNALSSRKFPKLTHIDFASNWIGTEGVAALGRAIQSGNLETLAQLFLYSAAMNDDDLATLATAFQHGEASVLPNLWRLDLEGNGFTQLGVQSLADALKSGRLDSLRSLDVGGSTSLSEEGANAIVSAFTGNSCLTVAVDIGWNKFPDLHRRYQQLRDRNIIKKANLAKLSEVPMVPAAFGKVYLCGSPEVGKTTLRRTLQRTFWQSLRTWERRPHLEKRTRGIDVSQFSSKGTKEGENPITLFVWDMAGQQDYHLVHNAFFPDLSSAEGKATIFVIVCNSKNLDEAKKQLEYWLRYIASSCPKTTKRLRHVFVVMNHIGGDKKVQDYEQDWKIFFDYQREKFTAFLDVHSIPFGVDVRRRRKVDGLKRCLLDHSRKFLKEERVPEICKIIQMSLTDWIEAKQDFPVLDWVEFEQKVQTSNLFSDFSDETVEAATKYLNEAGVVIYIDKSFPSHWGIPHRKFIVLNPNWFCNKVIGDIFLSEDMVGYGEHHRLFREKVNKTTGSVSISDFKDFFNTRWSDKEFEDLIVILLWLGLCYKGKTENLFIPSLIDKNGRPGDPWQPQSAHTDEEEQWVMGFSVLHKKSEMTLAPMTLWHRFQVELAQTPKFNGEVSDNGFVAGKYFMTFTVDYMNVLIEVDARARAREDFPTFNEITILVKPVGKEEDVSADERKQRQVNLASDLVDILLGLWDDICGGVQYVHKVVWPWPVSQSRPEDIQDRNVEVVEVRRDVQMHGMGKKMNYSVGRDSPIRYDQLLSTKDKYSVIKSAENGIENDVRVLRKGMAEAVKLGIYPPDELTKESGTVLAEGVASDGIEEATQPLSPNTRTILKAVREVGGKVDRVAEKLNDIEDKLREGFAKVLKEQKRVLRKVQDTERFFEEDKDRTCPNLIYLAEKESGAWATLKDAVSVTFKVRLRFACEAGYSDYRPHRVLDHQGLDVSALKPALKKIAPWLKVSLTILLISAKIGTNIVAPGAGLLLPDFDQIQQATSFLAQGIVSFTGYSMKELDELMMKEMSLSDTNDTCWNPRDVYGKSRAAITSLITNLEPEKYEQNFGLRKVRLSYRDGSLHGVVWICTECLKKFRDSSGNLVSEL